MKRRSLFALLGLGSAGGAAAWLTRDNISLEEFSGDQAPTLDDNLTFSDWGNEMQSELSDTSAYGQVSFATEANRVNIENDEQISVVSVEPITSDSDLFRFTTTSKSAVSDVLDLVAGTLRFSGELEFTVTLDGTSVDFTGGESAVGDFAGATGVHPDNNTIYIIRATKANMVINRAKSLET